MDKQTYLSLACSLTHVSDTLIVRPDDIIAEARGNLTMLDLNNAQRGFITSAAVEEFVHTAAAVSGKRLTAQQAGPMRFYCWHDAQAMQLRYSLVSPGHAALPFGCAIELVADPGPIARSFMANPPAGPTTPLPVWSVVVP